jgi:hypothetical protein
LRGFACLAQDAPTAVKLAAKIRDNAIAMAWLGNVQI